MDQESNSFEKCKVIASLPILFDHVSDIKKKKKKKISQIRKSSKPGHGNLFAEVI